MEFNPIKIFSELWVLLTTSQSKGIASEFLARLLVLFFYIWLTLQFLEKAAKVLVSLVESLGKLGMPLRSNQDQKLAIRRRQQFCGVLRSDLDSIAKAENWNDQWFTDLEAEIEAEGGYYSNGLARIFKRRSNGIRRIPSLMQAIRTSTERCMLLVGDPGCGKSVALRHLGRTLAEEGSKSKALNVQVPLYINLKELPACNAEELTPDYIEKFVLEHIRRGDSDTAAYVRDHWLDYKTKGNWFFLFDSFDESPAVLHAPNGSKIIERYSQALRQFMDGMGACRGVLASREYKGPEALPWQKLRILQLNQQKQDELIDNTYLTNQYKTLVRQHLATVGTGIFGNPLFMSLLCRYVGDTQKSPANDYDLLLRHIERLAHRDPEYILKKYGLNEAQLLEGATLLAVLFAEESELSLAPKYDEIKHALNVRQISFPVDLEQLLSALIDVKIGRSDVKEARAGDRRFTFSHRRYQETLFVQYLAQHPQHISTENLLLDSRWREFTVTLIQSQPAEVLNRFAEEAAHQIYILTQAPIAVTKELGEGLQYFEWRSGALLHLLQLVNEGFSKRVEFVPDRLREAIAHQLLPIWRGGDLYDKLMVVRHGCLLPVDEYQKILEWAIAGEIDPFLRASFMNAQFLTVLPDSLSKWIRKRFSNETLVCDSKIELLKLDALGNRLPENLGAPLIFQRCKILRSIMYQPWPIRIFAAQFQFLNGWLSKSFGVGQVRPLSNVESAMLAFFNVVTILWVSLEAAIKLGGLLNQSLLAAIARVCMVTFTLAIGMSIILRAEQFRLTPLYLVRRLRDTNISSIFPGDGKKLGAAIVFVLMSAILWGAFILADSHPLVFVILMAAFPVAAYVDIILRKRNLRKRLHRTLSSEVSMWEIIRQAHSCEELALWIEDMPEYWLADLTMIRSVLCHVEDRFAVSQNKSADIQSLRQRVQSKKMAKFLLFELEKSERGLQ
ncbi:MAG: ATP-binding protein [Gallionellaceae bacterium]|jgi:hypothetical protein